MLTYSPIAQMVPMGLRGFALCLLLTPVAFPENLSAADPQDSSSWQHRAALYLWMAGLDGTSGNKLQTGKIEASFSDIMKNLEAEFMLDYRGKKDKWGVGLDLIYINIGPGPTVSGPNPAPVEPPTISADADIDVEQWVVDFTGRYEIAKGLELLAGGHYVDVAIGGPVLGVGYSF